MYRGSKWALGIAAGLFTLTIAATAGADQTAPTCEVAPLNAGAAADGTSSLAALRPTLRIVAEHYAKQAAVYAEQADRYRSWASAEDMFGATNYGKRYAAIYFADEANELDKEAAESRALATKYRKLAEREASSGC